ncbi:MAG: heat shock protein Hsp20 [Myxococcales bacterium]|nr:heat shock protein Hsp20 [Myxococcales bacterium]
MELSDEGSKGYATSTRARARGRWFVLCMAAARRNRMATQKNDNGGSQSMTTQQNRGERQTGMSRQGSSQGRMMGRRMQQSPVALMRRMFDELDMSPIASPFSMMRRMFNDMERMLESSDMTGEQSDLGEMGLDWVPRIDVRRRDDQLTIHADLPGISPEQVRIYAQDDSIVLEGEREEVREARNEDRWQSERVYGRFRRVIPLVDGAQVEQAQARFENGVLEVMVPISESGRRGRRIEIQGAGGGKQQGQNVQNKPLESGQGQQQRPTERH